MPNQFTIPKNSKYPMLKILPEARLNKFKQPEYFLIKLWRSPVNGTGPIIHNKK